MLAALCRLGHNECSQSSSNLLEVSDCVTLLPLFNNEPMKLMSSSYLSFTNYNSISTEPCLSISNYQEWMAMPNPDIENPIPNSLRGTVLCTGIERGGVAHWDFLWQVIILLKGISQRSLSFCHISLFYSEVLGIEQCE